MQPLTRKCLCLGLLSGWAIAGTGIASAAGLDRHDASAAELQTIEPARPAHAPAGDPAVPAARQPALLQDWIALGSDQLDQMRGGFAIDPGLKVSFGIERTVSINGELQATTTFDFQDAGAFAGSRPGAALGAGAVQLIQNGMGNIFQPGPLSQAAAAIFIQNSLSHQTIQTHTIINASSNSLELLKSMNLQSTLQDAVTQATGIR